MKLLGALVILLIVELCCQSLWFYCHFAGSFGGQTAQYFVLNSGTLCTLPVL